MNNINKTNKKIFIYLFLLVIVAITIQYFRPDISLLNIEKNPEVLIFPLVLLFIFLNINRILKHIINKIIIITILLLLFKYFSPNYFELSYNYAKTKIPQLNFFLVKINDFLTPKNGIPPKFQFQIESNNYQIPMLNNNLNNIPTNPKDILPSIINNMPQDVQEKLNSSGIDPSNPIKTIENIQKNNKQDPKEILK